MAWNQFYWDTFHKYFWEPKWIEIDPVAGTVDTGDGYIKIPSQYVNIGKIKYRARKYIASKQKLEGDEDALNDIFNLIFSIAPDYIIRSWFCRPLCIDSFGQFRSYGRLEIADKFGWGEANVTQHDGFFTSDDAIVCVEIKLGATTDKIQVLKYIAMLILEEKLSGVRPSLGLLYIVPHPRKEKIISKIKEYAETALDLSPDLNSRVKNILESDLGHFRSVVDRIQLAAISWSDLCVWAKNELNGLNAEDAYQQTLYRLLHGFIAQLEVHRGTGI